MTVSPKDENRKTFLGDVKSPIAIGYKRDLWANLDNEFYMILELWRWYRTISIIEQKELPYHIACGLRYLIEEDLANNRIF